MENIYTTIYPNKWKQKWQDWWTYILYFHATLSASPYLYYKLYRSCVNLSFSGMGVSIKLLHKNKLCSLKNLLLKVSPSMLHVRNWRSNWKWVFFFCFFVGNWKWVWTIKPSTSLDSNREPISVVHVMGLSTVTFNWMVPTKFQTNQQNVCHLIKTKLRVD